jgi:hypothetical protein
MFSKAQQPQQTPSTKATTPFFKPEPVFKSCNANVGEVQQTMGKNANAQKNAPKPAPVPPPTPVATPPTVLNMKEQTKGQVKGCGELSDWIIKWELDQPSIKGGYIIQEVYRATFVQNCKEKDITANKTAKRWWHYWEAWKVNAGQKVTETAEKGDLNDDHFSVPDSGSRSSGNVIMGGIGRFYEGLTLPTDFKTHNSDTLAKSLPATTTDPQLSNGTYAGVRTLKYSWDCCKSPAELNTEYRTIT